MLAPALAAPTQPADVPTTLRETIRQSTTGNKAYRALRTAAGEPFIARTDLMTGAPAAGRVGQRRSLGYFGHTSDIHVQDTQSPSRLEPTNAFSPTLFPGTCRPQQAMSLFVQAQMVQAFSDAAYSPVTGAPMAAVLEHGGLCRSDLQPRDPLLVHPDHGRRPGDGRLRHPRGSTRAWRRGRKRPMPTTRTIRAGTCGALRLPQRPRPARGCRHHGGHQSRDARALVLGVRQPRRPVQRIRRAGRLPAVACYRRGEYWSFQSWALDMFTGMSLDPSPLQRALDYGRQQFGLIGGFKRVASDPDRKLLQGQDFMAAHFEDTGGGPGPVGHGWTQQNLDDNTTFWTADVGEHIRLFGLDTCNRVVGADGAVPRTSSTGSRRACRPVWSRTSWPSS